MELKNSIISQLKFKGCWRSYQKRILDELEYHLGDSKLNVVAAPGAGKTILGIETILRLKNPTFILAPTITIKNQWKQRILDNFLPSNVNPDLISTDIKNISEITISTYQGLHSLCKDSKERGEFVKNLKKLNIKTLVLDEAHHLRAEWWSTLNVLYSELKSANFKLVSLTATPPYDVSFGEWNNYNTLCGPIDAEISIPELVKAGDLCPHQDLIYFSDLTFEEKQTIFDFKKKRSEFFNDINKHSDILYAIEKSAFAENLDSNVEIIYKDINFTLALISYLLKEDGLSINARILTEFLDLNIEQIPKFDYEQAEILFEGIIGEFSQYFKNVPLIRKKLKDYNLINGKTVDFTGKINFKKLFARSKNKLDAIYNITDIEFKNLNSDLREVILLDFIGKGDSEGVNILSVFDRLQTIKVNCAILTGSLIVIPKTSKEELLKILKDRNIDTKKVLTTEFDENSKEYLRVEVYGNIDIVSVITELFQKGLINVLIGTSALLGEGWDSPCVNTLIIASVIGSFMLSNQMRGRALRIDKNNPNKTSNIWHLVSLTQNDCSPDLKTVKKRFNAFEGISYKDNEIQSGIERLGFDCSKINSLDCEILNKKMINYALNRAKLPDKWKQVFKKCKKNVASKVYQTALINTNSNQDKGNEEYLNFIENLMKDLNKRQKLKISQKTQLKIANCVLKTLCDMEKIETPFEKIKIKSYKDNDDRFYLTFLNCTDTERNLLTKSFCEIFSLNEDVRYILKFSDKKEIKYLPVPEAIGLNGKNVKLFLENIKVPSKSSDMTRKITKAICFLQNKFLQITLFYYLAFLAIFCFVFSFALEKFFIPLAIGLAIGLIFLGISVVFKLCGIVIAGIEKIITKLTKPSLPNTNSTDIIFTKSPKNRQEVLKAKYNIYLSADIKQSRIWI